jgi:hypothetical protein
MRRPKLLARRRKPVTAVEGIRCEWTPAV